MSWEVRTMQSKTSYFNATLFRKNLSASSQAGAPTSRMHCHSSSDSALLGT